jgi:uroporphyrinogen-III synthase
MVSGMQKNEVHILSTGPVEKALIEEAARLKIIIDEISFIKTEEIISEETEAKIKELSNQNIWVIFTSGNAVEAVGKRIASKHKWKIFCLGNATTNVVTKYLGVGSILGTAENATVLANKILENANVKAVTFFCGDHRRDELPQKLKSRGIGVEEIIVYKTLETTEVVNKEYDAILFYSPSAVNSFFVKNSISAKTQLFAIGTTTGDALKHFTQQPVILAEIPGKETLVMMAINHFSKSKIS